MSDIIEPIVPDVDEKGYVTDPFEAGRLWAWENRLEAIVAEIKGRYARMIISAFDPVPLEALRILAGLLLPTTLGQVIDQLVDDRLVDRDSSENRYARLLTWGLMRGDDRDEALIDRLEGAESPPWPAVRSALVAARAELAVLPEAPSYGVHIMGGAR